MDDIDQKDEFHPIGKHFASLIRNLLIATERRICVAFLK
jgi:hypothetical protein